MATYRLTEEQPEGDCFYLPRLCVFAQVIRGEYNTNEVQRLVESETERRGIQWDGTVGSVPPLLDPVDVELL